MLPLLMEATEGRETARGPDHELGQFFSYYHSSNNIYIIYIYDYIKKKKKHVIIMCINICMYIYTHN